MQGQLFRWFQDRDRLPEMIGTICWELNSSLRVAKSASPFPRQVLDQRTAHEQKSSVHLRANSDRQSVLKRPEPVKGCDVVGLVIATFATQKLIQVSHFDSGLVFSRAFPAQTDEETILGKAVLLSPVRRIQVEECFVPSYKTQAGLKFKRAVYL